MNKGFSKFYVSVRRKDGRYYKRNSLLSVRAALDPSSEIAALPQKNFHLRGTSIISWIIKLQRIIHLVQLLNSTYI